jgi:NitT/TauT family transport system substrate-binding protein
MLASGRTDVIIAWLTDKQRYTTQLSKIGKDLNVIPWSTQGMDLYGISLVASERFLKNRPDAAEKFARAFYKSMRYVTQYPEESADIVNKQIPKISPLDALFTIKEFNKLAKIKNEETFPERRFNSAKLSSTWEKVAFSQDIDEEKLDPSTLVHVFP